MLPLHHHRRGGKHKRDVHRRVLDSDAPVRAAAEHKVVLRICVRAACGIQPAVGVELLGRREDGGVMQRVEE